MSSLRVKAALSALRRGQFVVVADDQDRENEGDLILAAESMTAAANGSVNVSSSVERLKATIEDARGASMKVVTKATDMADEAHRLDSTVKSFLREVTA